MSWMEKTHEALFRLLILKETARKRSTTNQFPSVWELNTQFCSSVKVWTFEQIQMVFIWFSTFLFQLCRTNVSINDHIWSAQVVWMPMRIFCVEHQIPEVHWTHQDGSWIWNTERVGKLPGSGVNQSCFGPRRWASSPSGRAVIPLSCPHQVRRLMCSSQRGLQMERSLEFLLIKAFVPSRKWNFLKWCLATR